MKPKTRLHSVFNHQISWYIFKRIVMEKITVYTDGACSGNPGAGAWAFVLLAGELKIEKSGFYPNTTNNRMELQAAIEALREAERVFLDKKNTSEALKKSECAVDFFSDSQYVKNGITAWILNWKRNNWKTSAKKPVLNRDLWETLDGYASRFSVSWNWVKGHNGNKYNEICDALCKTSLASRRSVL